MFRSNSPRLRRPLCIIRGHVGLFPVLLGLVRQMLLVASVYGMLQPSPHLQSVAV